MDSHHIYNKTKIPIMVCKANVVMNINVKTFNKITAGQIQENMKPNHYHSELIPGMQGWLNT